MIYASHFTDARSTHRRPAARSAGPEAEASTHTEAGHARRKLVKLRSASLLFPNNKIKTMSTTPDLEILKETLDLLKFPSSLFERKFRAALRELLADCEDSGYESSDDADTAFDDLRAFYKQLIDEQENTEEAKEAVAVVVEEVEETVEVELTLDEDEESNSTNNETDPLDSIDTLEE